MNGPIFLIGLSGSGKSTVGRLLAARLQLPFLDTDALIEQRARIPIAEIFSTKGEAAFRDLERAALQEAVGRPGVVSTGGGLPLDPQNRATMQRTGTTFWLDAPTLVLIKRLQSGLSERPLLKGDPQEAIERLRRERHVAYARVGTRVDTADRSPAEVVAELAARLRVSAGSAWSADPDPPVWINTSAHSYGVYVGSNVFDRLPELMERHGLASRLLVIADERVAGLHEARITRTLRSIPHSLHLVPAGEQHKTLDRAAHLYDDLLAEKPERGDIIVALGGGVIGDLAGFIAATLLRGVRFVQVPTTILSQVDSSVGGKVAVDHPRGKNLIGAFHQPSLVLADLEFLRSLPLREVPAGLAEVVKIAVVRDEELFAAVESHVGGLRTMASGGLGPAIRRAIELKARLVEQDERDLTGARALLNYGHTLGQALEAATGYGRFLHGEAIAIGMGAAARIACWMGLHPEDAVKRQDAVLEILGLPNGAPGASAAAIRAALGLDKKREGGHLKWVLPSGIGRARAGCTVPNDLVDRALDWIVEGAE